MSSDGKANLMAGAIAGAMAGAATGIALYAAMKLQNGGLADAQRAKKAGVQGRRSRPIVIAGGPNLEKLATSIRKRLGDKEYDDKKEGPTILVEYFKSNDPNMKFNFTRCIGRKIVFLFDTVDQARFFEQLSLIQALQGFAVPDGEDKASKWKTYMNAGSYAWGRASQITVVVPWYRPCQMERTSRWHLNADDGTWTNSNPAGEWLDCPTAQYMARLLATPGSVPPAPGPNRAMDEMPIHPLWRPPLELVFVELHEEMPVGNAVSDLGATIRMERFVPYFLEKFKAKAEYPGKNKMYILFPDHGAFDRYVEGVKDRLKLDADHILYIKKTRVGEKIGQEQELFYLQNGTEKQKTTPFSNDDHILIIDDFTNSGSTLFGAVKLARDHASGSGDLNVSIFVSHLVATYDSKVVDGLKKKLRDLGPKCRFFTTNTIPLTTDMLKDEAQATVVDISDFIADMVQR
eukprot:TRINITY_DN52127_c0_g1_i1.p1 TRINITY_DN52127_c0_g1~~TRINITY_DN52127_c0_g1_i1.p1  ORF type:complete len:484 (-),score=86.91 TRINITY_DN52127_c0_g1_i1:63-1445(-)